MAKQSVEAKLRRRAVKNRRGVFGTWGYPDWDAILLKPPEGKDPADAVAECAGVGAVVRDATVEVLGRTWEPPLGEWALLVVPKATPWAHLVSHLRGDDVRQRLRDAFGAETLQTGYQDTTSIVYVRYYVDGVEHLNFVTDGNRWDRDEDEDGEGITRLSGDVLGADWLDRVESAPEAHQFIVKHFDAYVPGLVFCDGGLGAAYGHEDFLSAEHIQRIDVVRFGIIPKDDPSSDSTAANRRLHEAVGQSDFAGVKAALAAGATLGPLPDGNASALWTACYNLGHNRPDAEAIIDLLLEAGADPNLYPTGGGTCHLLYHLVANDRGRLKATRRVIRKVAAAGADVNPQSSRGVLLGGSPLHLAARKARADLVRVLLEVGASPLTRDDEGHTPRESVAHLLEGQSRYMTPKEMESEREGYAEVLVLLEAAEFAHQRSRGGA